MKCGVSACTISRSRAPARFRARITARETRMAASATNRVVIMVVSWLFLISFRMMRQSIIAYLVSSRALTDLMRQGRKDMAARRIPAVTIRRPEPLPEPIDNSAPVPSARMPEIP